MNFLFLVSSKQLLELMKFPVDSVIRSDCPDWRAFNSRHFLPPVSAAAFPHNFSRN